MKLVADESVDRQIVERLRDDGHDVAYVAEMSAGISDEEVLDETNSKQAILITSDKDFGELVVLQKRVMAGVVLLRLGGWDQSTKADHVSSIIEDHSAKLNSAFTVITKSGLRIRPLSPPLT